MFGRLLLKNVNPKRTNESALLRHWQYLKRSSETELSFTEWKKAINDEINIGCYVPVNEEIVVVPFEVQIPVPMIPELNE